MWFDHDVSNPLRLRAEAWPGNPVYTQVGIGIMIFLYINLSPLSLPRSQDSTLPKAPNIGTKSGNEHGRVEGYLNTGDNKASTIVETNSSGEEMMHSLTLMRLFGMFLITEATTWDKIGSRLDNPILDSTAVGLGVTRTHSPLICVQIIYIISYWCLLFIL